jgi:hypothetical protein
MRDMTTRLVAPSRKLSILCGLLLFLDSPPLLLAKPTPAAVAAFNAYTSSVESRLAQQHRSTTTFLALADSDQKSAELRLRHGDLIIERLTPYPSAGVSGALLHHWRGTAFAPGATASDFERLMRDFNSYPQNFSPQVVQARVLTLNGNRMTAWMRVRQHHVITVVMDSTYDIASSPLDVRHGYSTSQSTGISEIASPGTRSEHTLNSSEEHGFLWRLNTYWSYEERDGGLYLQIETVSLSRSIPTGLGWALSPYVESVPRESLEFTLRSACAVLRK